jgi:hypothetical protein
MKLNLKMSVELSEIEKALPIYESLSDCRTILNRFESTEEDYRDQYFSHLYLSMWKIALRIGKLNLASLYAKKSFSYLLKYKRIPQIKIFIHSLNESGLLKKESKEFLRKSSILLGDKSQINPGDFSSSDLMDDHPEYWKDYSQFLKNYLLLNEEWTLEHWKLCYEYILLNHFDKDIFLALREKAFILKNASAVSRFNEIFKSKKIRITPLDISTASNDTEALEHLHVDYDQVAMDLLSGEIKPTSDEQTRVINSLKLMSDQELKNKGKDMIIAFELLGMENVVLFLCEKVVSLTTETKSLASLYFVWVQALVNNGDSFKAVDLIDEVLQKEPIYGEERIAFLYLKAEACLKLNKIKKAKMLFLEIKKFNPTYRLVGERLKALETT